MIALRLIIVGVLIVIVALALAWLLTRDAKYLSWIRRVLYFALIVGLVSALLYVIERVVLR